MDQFESSRELWAAIAALAFLAAGVILLIWAIAAAADHWSRDNKPTSTLEYRTQKIDAPVWRDSWIPAEEWRELRYGVAHKEEKAKYRKVIAEHGGVCMERVCVMPTRQILAGADWDLAHDHERGGHQDYLGPAHPECNRAEARSRGVSWDESEAEEPSEIDRWGPGGDPVQF